MHVHVCKMTTETFDPSAAMELWMQWAHRRLNQISKKDDQSTASTSVQLYELSEEEEELQSELDEDL